MALYGGQRDISLFRNLNRELLGDIITQQCSFYKFRLDETKVNIYGEASEEKYYTGPILLNCLIDRGDQERPITDVGVDFNRGITFKFLRDDLLNKAQDFNINSPYGADLVVETGEIIMYQERYYEVNSIDRKFVTLPGTGTSASVVGEPGLIVLYVLSAYLTRTIRLNLIKYSV